jgi:dTDP-4-amino-4,6-dideoxygalactose transaminase
LRVPFVDLHAQYVAHKSDIDAAMASVIRDTAFVGGRYVKEFEGAFSSRVNARYCIGVANGTDALYIVLRMLGVGPGDEVVTTALSWIATSETISQAGARPVFVDIDESGIIDPGKLRRAISSRTRAIVPVHLYGQAAAMDEIMAVAREFNLHVVEDCAQAHLAAHGETLVGKFGIAGTYSFYPGKNLGAYGDAGAIVTDDEALAIKCRAFANHGALVKHEHVMEGVNSRLDGLQASLLMAKLPHLAAWTARRREVAARYDDALRHCPGLTLPRRIPGSTHVYHLYVVCTDRRDELKAFLGAREIETAVHYPTALPFLKAYSHLNARPEDFPVAARFTRRIISLPMYPELSGEMQDYVCRNVLEFFAASRA